jgi:hypothetical protein
MSNTILLIVAKTGSEHNCDICYLLDNYPLDNHHAILNKTDPVLFTA